MLITGFCFVGVTITVRYVGPRIPAAESAFIRYLVGTLFLLPVYYRIMRGSVKVPMPGLMSVRGVSHAFGVILWFYAMAHIPIAQVTALSYMTPVVVTVGAAIFLGEVLHLRRLVAVVVGFFGVLVILRPGFTEISLGQIAQLATTPLFAVSMLLTKKLTAKAEPMVIVAALSLVCTVTLLPFALLNWVTPNLTELVLLSLTAALATFGHYAMTLAFKNAPITALQPISFLQLLWATVAGIVLFGEQLDIYVVAGGAILVLSATYIAHRESVINRAAREAGA